jgi:hypothetical protein
MLGKYTLLRWLPALGLMLTIFTLSSLPASGLPFFGDYDVLIKKASHALGYAMLGLAYFIALPPRLSRPYRWTLGLLMALIFALSDEYHQSFVDGRTSSLRDVMIDGAGAAVAVSIGAIYSSNSKSKATS